MKEPEIKLFGMKINLLENGGVFSGERGVGDDFNGSLEVYREEDEGRAHFGLKHEQVIEEDQETGEFCASEPLYKDENPGLENESRSTNSSSELDENPKTPSIEEDEVSEDHLNNTKEQNDPQQKTLKKPDKILPCPRCNSMDTKFCYYNNYNVNQPRHFCKSCQRYWTAGGTMRNVPVGAGRRKNKNSTSHFGHITISTLTKFDSPNGFHHASFKPNGTVLSFGPDSPVCESMATEKRIANVVINVDDCSLGSSVTTPNSTGGGGKNGLHQPIMQNQNNNGVQSTIPFIPGVPWSFPWNSAIPMPAICPPGYPMPFYPSSYWNCGVPNAWNVPWLPVPSPTVTQNSAGSNPNSPLGKHSRNGELLKPKNSERKEHSDLKHSQSSIVIPKTLRIDDPEEAAKSSIWSTLGIKYDSISREGLFKALQPKGEEKKTMAAGSSPALQANPVALSRSINFQERA